MTTHEPIDQIGAIRKRPAMYVGSTAMFGFINYLVCPVALMLAYGAKRVHAVARDGFEVSSDAAIPVRMRGDGRVAPFQEILPTGEGHDFEATVLNALSQVLRVTVRTGAQASAWRFTQGVLQSHGVLEAEEAASGTTLWFEPDRSIFSVTDVSRAAFASYFRRLSFLHQGVRFVLTVGADTEEYYSADGIAELFNSIAAPYQLMHERIYIQAEDSGASLTLAMAFHSWNENHIWCFINRGRAVQGGTHEQGLLQGLRRLKRKLNVPEHFNNGVVAVASIRYPGAVWEGCIKGRVGNPELRPIISRMVTEEAWNWFEAHPQVREQIRATETFQFPEMWLDKLR